MFRLLLEYRHILIATLVFVVSILKYTAGQQEIECGRRPNPVRYYDEDKPWGDNPQIARREDFPWQVGIFRRSLNFMSFKYECGGTLIPGGGDDGDVLVLTSARCVTEGLNSTKAEPKLENIRIVIGPISSNYNKNNDETDSQKFKVRYIEINPLYEGKLFGDADAAILQIDGRVKLGKYAYPACIPSKNTPKLGVSYGMVGEIAGFGWDSRRNVTESLRYARYPISTSGMCQEKMGVKVNDYLEFCTGYQKDGTACQGDYGGGLVFRHPKNKGRFYVQGILSSLDTSPITEDGFCENFNVFQRVGPYLEWIRKTQEKLVKEDDSDESSPKPRPTPGVPLNHIPEFAKITRDFHNHFRSIHKAPPLRLVEKLQQSAQILAGELAEDDSFEISEDSPYSTNIYVIPQYVVAQDAVRAAVEHWYRSFTKYDREDPRPSAFTQMVWKSSSQIGVGVATNGKKTVVVANYWPKGNIINKGANGYQRTRYFSENVSVLPKGYYK